MLKRWWKCFKLKVPQIAVARFCVRVNEGLQCMTIMQLSKISINGDSLLFITRHMTMF